MTTIAHNVTEARWLLFIFTLPTNRASQRVDAWKKLRRYGALALKMVMCYLMVLPIASILSGWVR